MSYFDYDDRPSRGELEAEAFAERVRDSHIEQWNETRHGQVYDRTGDHKHLTKLISALEAHREAYIEENEDEEADAIADDAALADDPYKYYGVHRSDF